MALPMPDIVDVSPTKHNTNSVSTNQSAIGRMLSVASSPDGKLVFAGSYSNLWRSADGGTTWNQVTTLQPQPDKFEVTHMLGGWGVVDITVAAGWDIKKHPLVLADVTGDACADIVGFRDGGVWTA